MPTIGNDFKVEIEVNESLIDAESIKVLIRKPDTIIFEEKEPTLIDTGLSIITYNVTSVYNDKAGEWTFKVQITNSESLISTSTSQSIIIDE